MISTMLSAVLTAFSALIVSALRVGGFVTSSPHVTFESTVDTHPLDVRLLEYPFFLGFPEVAVWTDCSISASTSSSGMFSCKHLFPSGIQVVNHNETSFGSYGHSDSVTEETVLSQSLPGCIPFVTLSKGVFPTADEAKVETVVLRLD
jgi:hypothetical protein